MNKLKYKSRKFFLDFSLYSIILLICLAMAMILLLLIADQEPWADVYVNYINIASGKPLSDISYTLTGQASFYDYVTKDGWSSVGHYVCATREFERYSYLKVTNLDNNKSVVCKKTDYGPDPNVWPERIIDLSSTAFAEIGSLKRGILPNVTVEKL
jgi:rare lipoprotein A (peptidoglycan hydrolase)